MERDKENTLIDAEEPTVKSQCQQILQNKECQPKLMARKDQNQPVMEIGNKRVDVRTFKLSVLLRRGLTAYCL